MRRLVFLYGCLFYFCRISLVCGQSLSAPFFRNFELGPKASTVHSFAQDSLGILWLGSNNGLYSFDGYALHRPSLLSPQYQTFIYSIAVLNASHMALGTGSGVLLYNYREDCYEPFPPNGPNDVRALLLRGEKLWIGSLSGLFCYDINKKELLHYNKKLHPEIGSPAIYSLAYDEAGKMLMGTYNGLFELSPATGNVKQLLLPDYKAGANQFVNSMFVVPSKEELYIGTEYGLYHYDFPSKRLVKAPVLQTLPIKSIAARDKDHLLIGTDDGLFIYQIEKQALTRIKHDSRNPNSLANNIVWSLSTDRSNNTWVGTDLGFSVWSDNQQEKRFPIFSLTESSDGNRFYKLLKDRNGWYWLGGDNGLIRTRALGDKQRESYWYRMDAPDLVLPHNRIRDIYEDTDGYLWMASDGGVNLFDEGSRMFRSLTIVDSTGRKNAKWAYAILADQHRRLWVATYMGGIFVLDKHKLLTPADRYVATKNYGRQQGLLADFANQLVADRKEQLWALFYNKGLNRIDMTTGKVHEVRDGNGQSFSEATFMLKDLDDVIWIGQHGKVTRLSPNGKFKEIMFDPLGQGEVKAMEEVGQFLWITTSEGLWQIDKSTLQATLLRYGINVTSLFYDKERREILLGGINEINVLSSDAFRKADEVKNIVLTAMHINGEPFGITGYGLRYRKEITLAHNQNNLLLEFSDLNFGNPRGHRLAYSFKSENETWIPLERGENRVQLANLSPGNYILQVAKVDMFGQVVSKIFPYKLSILPPWYASPWAKMVYGLAITGMLLWVLNFYRVRNTLKWERRERHRVLELTRMKTDFLTAISHDLKTPLSLILAPVSQLALRTKNPENKRILEGVHRNALKINHLIHEVMAFDQSEEQLPASHTPMASEVDLVTVMSRIIGEWQHIRTYEHLAFRFYSSLDSFLIHTDVTKLESILNNLLSNACKYGRKEGGLVELGLEQLESGLAIVVRDNGVGIVKSDIPYVFGKFYRSPAPEVREIEGTGVGLYLVKTYCEQLGWRPELTSSPESGTQVTIHLMLAAPSTTADFQETKDGERKKLLIVEDNQELSSFLKESLEPLYACAIVQNGRQALQLIDRHYLPDLIVSDAMMPVMDGLEMAKMLRKSSYTASVPIILLTAKNDERIQWERIAVGIDAFVSKPFDLELLKLQIRQLLDRKDRIMAQLRLDRLQHPKVEKELESPDELLLVRITRIIEEHIDDSELSVQLLSEQAAIGTKQLYRKIKQLTGFTPVEYIRTIRMKKAAILLKQQNFTVAEVMYMVGFTNASYFSKCFQAEFSLTPKHYMEQHATD